MKCSQQAGESSVPSGNRSRDIVFRVSYEGLLDFINDGVEQLGWNPADLAGKHFNTLIHPDLVVSIGKLFTTPVLATNRGGNRSGIPAKHSIRLIPREWRKLRDDSLCATGTLLLLGEVASAQFFECLQPAREKTIVGIVGYITDIALPETQARTIEKQSRLESIGIMAAGVAHDFNNFLTGIYGNLQLARSFSGIPHEVMSYLDEVFKSLSLARGLTRQLQSYARCNKQERTVFNLSEIIKEACALSLCGASTRCEVGMERARHVIEADRTQMVQLFCNIIINARQAMCDEGLIEITLRQCSMPPDNALQLTAGVYEAVRFKDHGPGISAPVLAGMFTPFLTTKQGGSGLGLATGYSIAKNHGGTIVAESVEGKGSVFTVYLPSTASIPPAELPAEGEKCMQKGCGRILVMDDESFIRQLLGEVLTQAGYQPVLASSGDHAIELFKQAIVEGNRFDAALLDLTISGGMGGEKIARVLGSHDPMLVAVALSGYLPPEVETRLDKELFVAFLAKPFLCEEVLHTVAKAVEKRKQRTAMGRGRPAGLGGENHV